MPSGPIVVIILLAVLYVLVLVIIARTLYEKATSQATSNYSITWNFVRRLPLKLRPLTLGLIIIVWPVYALVMLIVGISIFVTAVPELVRDFFSEMRNGIHHS